MGRTRAVSDRAADHVTGYHASQQGGYVTAPDHVFTCDLGPATVLVNGRTGDVQTLYGPAARWWAELAATGETNAPEALDPTSARALLGQLLAAGLLVFCPRQRPWPPPPRGHPIVPSWGTQETQAGRIPIPPVPFRVLPLAALALLVVLTVTHGQAGTRMSRLTRLLAWASRRGLHPAAPHQARHAVHAVRRVGLLTPGRVACLEESAAATLVLAASRLRVRWCHGVAADPIRLHAWVETEDGQPVAEPESTRRYTRLHTIPEQRTGDDHHQ
jgi:hypothetical protein